MLKNRYKISIYGKNIKSFIKYLYRSNISFFVISIESNKLSIIVDQNNYDLLCNIRTSYKIKVDRIYGFIYLKYLLLKNKYFIISLIISSFIFILLSSIIFEVDIKYDDIKIRNYISNYLKENKISKYNFIKSYDYISNIKKDFLNSNDNYSWIEIERFGAKYIVQYERKIEKKNINLNSFNHIVAKKDAIIKEIKASNGEIIKKVNDYVSKGDIIISGEIHKNEDIVGNTSAEGEIYGETWYKINVKLPIYFYEEKKTGNIDKNIKISFLDDSKTLFSTRFNHKRTKSTNIYSDFFNIFSIDYNIDEELYVNESVNLITSENIALKYARDKISSKLTDKEYIISQKKLKTTLNDSTINVEFFFKVYENITQIKRYSISKGT